LGKRLAEAVFTGVEQIANPPRPGALTPKGELQRARPIVEPRPTGDPHADRRELKRA
jgi:hypothetical protein